MPLPAAFTANWSFQAGDLTGLTAAAPCFVLDRMELPGEPVPLERLIVWRVDYPAGRVTRDAAGVPPASAASESSR